MRPQSTEPNDNPGVANDKQLVPYPANDLGPANAHEAISILQGLLGPCVLVACKGKRPIRRAWQKLRIEDMTAKYLDTLVGNNIGVSLGEPSGGLISIDFDTDNGLESFIRHNPALASTLRTRGRRGGNLWLRAIGEVPPSRKLINEAGEAAGELRSTGNQTIIRGLHPDTRQPYEIVILNPPTTTIAATILWCPEVHPAEWHKPATSSPQCDIESKGDEETQRDIDTQKDSAAHLWTYRPLYHTSAAVSTALAALDAQHSFEQFSGASVSKIYERFVERRHTAMKHGRNDFITQAVPFLYRALSSNRVMEFSVQFYQRHQAVFRDPIHQHENETRAMLEAVATTYLEQMPPDERTLYERLSLRQQDAYRICKDLASNTSDSEFPPPLFYLSCQELADRIDVKCEQGRRLLSMLVRLGIIGVHEMGVSHTKGQLGRATVYRWQLTT